LCAVWQNNAVGPYGKWNEDAQYEMELNHAEELDYDDFDTYHRSMMLTDSGGNFLILALGLIMSTAVFLVEMCVVRHSECDVSESIHQWLLKEMALLSLITLIIYD
jgi:hypothetical protein